MKQRFSQLKLSISLIILLLTACTSDKNTSEDGAVRHIETKAKPNVIVILIDTLRADHLGFNGYERDTSPVLDKFASENLNFKYAYSSSAWTPPAVASLFTGVYASVHGHMPLKSDDDKRAQGKFSKVDEGFVTLAESFTENGYDTACISANPMVDHKYGLSQGFKHFYSPGRETAQVVNQRSLKYLKDLRDKDKPFFLYIHYMDPHFPYTPIPPYDTMFTGPLKSRQYKPREVKFIGRYDGEIRYVDTKVGEMFDWLKANNLYEDTIILIVADHGEQFMERGHLGHADRLHTEEVHVPFILKAGGRKGDIITPVSLIDAFPTLMEASGLQAKQVMNGISLLSKLEARKSEGVLLEIVRHWNQKAIINSEGKKLLMEYKMETGLVNPDPSSGIKEFLFDIYKDNREVNPIDDKDLIGKMKEAIVKYNHEVLNLKKNYKTSEIDMDKDTYEKLKTLGYI